MHRLRISQSKEWEPNRLALQAELGLAVRGHGAPCSLVSSLAVVTNGRWLPWLIESLEEESVEAPVDQGAETVLIKVFGVGETALGSIVVGSDGRRPSGLAVPDLGHVLASGDLLEVGDGLVHVVTKRRGTKLA
jgi:hypothetical protein